MTKPFATTFRGTALDQARIEALQANRPGVPVVELLRQGLDALMKERGLQLPGLAHPGTPQAAAPAAKPARKESSRRPQPASLKRSRTAQD